MINTVHAELKLPWGFNLYAWLKLKGLLKIDNIIIKELALHSTRPTN